MPFQHPHLPARNFKFQRKNGVDGNIYCSLPDKNGRFWWVITKRKSSSIKKSKIIKKNKPYRVRWWRDKQVYKRIYMQGKVYKTHFNGDQPFDVYVTENKVCVYEKFIWPCNKLIISIRSFEKVFIGQDRIGEENAPGNSILVKINPHSYIFIGSIMYSFKAKDEIVAYRSPIGRNDVPYPFAVGKKYTYLMIEDVKIPNKWLIGEDDPYQLYYSIRKRDVPLYKKKYGFKTKLIEKRKWP